MSHRILLSLLLLSAVSAPISGQTDPLLTGFLNPPQEARPRVWWHWMNGNITQDGIRKDLLWMHRMGIAGVHIFDANLSTPTIVKQRATFMSPAWKDCFRYAVHEADSLGMEVAIQATPGWSNTGGPWVKPADAMKKLVWRTCNVKGGRRIRLRLPEPYRTNGTFQNAVERGRVSKQHYYADIAVMAVRQSGADLNLRKQLAEVSASSGTFSTNRLTDGDLSRADTLRGGSKDNTMWIGYRFKEPVTVSALSIADGQFFSQYRWIRPMNNKWLEVSDDGQHYRKVLDVPNGSCPLNTISFKPVSARYFRLVYKNPKRPIGIAEFNLYAEPKVNHAEEKAGFGTPTDLTDYPTSTVSGISPTADVINLTAHTDSTGLLRWDAPAGQWTIYRFGYSLTGKMNHPAPPEATGLEADKLDSAAMRRYLDKYFEMFESFVPGQMGKGITSLLMDSYEAGIANWTQRMPEEFGRRRGYSLLPWMPALAGVVIKDGATTDKFLFDYRLTLSELMKENLYDGVTGAARRHGMTSYIESHETCRVMEPDGMSPKRNATYPMGAMWATIGLMNYVDGDFGKQADTHETASVAHIYGQNIAAAESMTSNGLDGQGIAYSLWSGCLKAVADLEFANGINRIVVHSSDHQPDDTHLPGMSLGIYGQWFHRHDTWAEHARPWVDYLSRSSFMLQQGQNVADVAYYYGDDANATSRFSTGRPAVPDTYAFDYVSTPVLNDLHCEAGRLVAPSGVSYRLLALDANTRRMTLSTLRRIASWIRQGLNVCGAKPTTEEAMSDDAQAFHSLADELWSGKYKNVHTTTVRQALESMELMPDFICQRSDSVRYVHRQQNDVDIYWVNNRSFTPCTLHAVFRVSGRQPERWNPETGQVSRLGYEQANGCTHVDLPMEGGEACFVVFRQPTDVASVPAPKAPSCELLQPLTAPWTVSFQQGRGAPAQLQVDTLRSYTDYKDDGIRYFSGTARYTTSFDLNRKQIGKGRIVLDLGRVGVLAEVTVNGRQMGQCWHAPYRIDITDAVHTGHNDLQIEVVNMWRNRIIGDRQPGQTRHYTFVSYPFFKANSPLMPSGLMGPVRLLKLSVSE